MGKQQEWIQVPDPVRLAVEREQLEALYEKQPDRPGEAGCPGCGKRFPFKEWPQHRDHGDDG